MFMDENYKSIALASSSDVLNENNEFLFKVLNEINRWSESEVELAQGRTNFQIEKFIIHDNYTIPSAFKSALVNRKSVAEALLFRIVDAKKAFREFNYKWEGKDKTEPIWWKTRDGGEELCWYDIDEFNLNILIQDLNKGFKEAVDELEFFDKIINRLIELNGGELITKEQYDEDQPNYWKRRLASQSYDDLLSSKTGINSGNIRSMRRSIAPTVLKDGINKIKGSFGDLNDPIGLLDSLQKSVNEGISEITDMSGEYFSGLDEEKKKEVKSLFNQKLKK